MPVFWLCVFVIALAVIGFVTGRQRALLDAGGNNSDLHSLPSYYGWNVFMKTIVPAFGLMVIWLIIQPLVVQNSISRMIPASEIREG